MLDALIDGQDGHVTGSGEAAVIQNRAEIPEDGRLAVALGDDTIDEIGAGEVERLFVESFGGVGQQGLAVLTE